MLRGIIGRSPWLGDWKQCTLCGYQTREKVFSCPKCHDNEEREEIDSETKVLPVPSDKVKIRVEI